MIPSRYNSKRFPGKALALVGGKPLIQGVYESSRESGILDELFIVTDDERIYNTAVGFGAPVIVTGESRTGTDRVAEAARRLRFSDIVVNIQGDQPDIHPQHIMDVVSVFFMDKSTKMSTLAYKPNDGFDYNNPNYCKVAFDNYNNALFFSRHPISEYKHLGIYAYTWEFLKKFSGFPTGVFEEKESLEQMRVLENGFKVKVVVTKHDSPSIDVPGDI